MSKNSHRAGTAQRGAPMFYRAGADRIFFLTVLSPREFRRATEAGSSLLPQGVARFRHICHLTLRQKFNILK